MTPLPLSHFPHPLLQLSSSQISTDPRDGRLQASLSLYPTKATTNLADLSSIVAAILGIAGAGFRLSLVLNAIGVEMATADVEIQNIARAISNYAFTLKQLALTLESTKSIATQSAMETAKQIADQSQLVFDDIKEMADLDQHKDENGNLRSIAINERVKWCFKKQRLQYLLGQLESMKLSLSLMLQVLQFARLIGSMR